LLIHPFRDEVLYLFLISIIYSWKKNIKKSFDKMFLSHVDQSVS